MPEPILAVRKLKKYFPVTTGFLSARPTAWVRSVDEIDLDIRSGETFGLVGESGCGKSTTGFCILGLYTPTSGTIRFNVGADADHPGDRHAIHRSVQAVFQDPFGSLSPRLRVRSIVAEPLLVNTGMTRAQRNDRVREVIAQVGLPPESPDLYPHEFSGGQRQRIALARALAVKPKLVVLDEPVSSLDVSIRAQVMNLLKDLQQSLGVAYLLIAHDLANVRYMSSRVAVMYLGKIVESAPAEELFSHPLHPYTQALLSAALPSHPDSKREEIVLTGEVPSPISIPPGCRFHLRCFRANARCRQEAPAELEASSRHFVCCHCWES